MSAHKDWCSCEDCVRDTPDDRHLACRAEMRALEERLRASEDRARLTEARAGSAWQKTAQLMQRHDAEAGRLVEARDRAERATREAVARAERYLDCHAGPGTTEPACEACLACLHRLVEADASAAASARTRLRQLRDSARDRRDAYYTGQADAYQSALRLLGEPE